MLQHKRPTKRTKKPLVILAGFALVAAAAIGMLELTDTTHLLHKGNTGYVTTPNTPTRTANSDTKGEPSTPVTSPKTPVPAPPADNKNEDNITDPNTPLQPPSGVFVSNHRPNLDGQPAPNTIQSVCNTTPGANCQIIFTQGATTKQLPAQQTDRGGASYWTWKLQDVGLTEGTWHIQAKATLGTQVKTATDDTNMEVGS